MNVHEVHDALQAGGGSLRSTAFHIGFADVLGIVTATFNIPPEAGLRSLRGGGGGGGLSAQEAHDALRAGIVDGRIAASTAVWPEILAGGGTR